MFPWLYFAFFNPFVLAVYPVVLVLLGVVVLRRNRRALVLAVTLVAIETAPSVLLLPAFGGITIVALVPRLALVAILAATLRRQPVNPARAGTAMHEGEARATFLDSREPPESRWR